MVLYTIEDFLSYANTEPAAYPDVYLIFGRISRNNIRDPICCWILKKAGLSGRKTCLVYS